jgi:hypothetical protein
MVNVWLCIHIQSTSPSHRDPPPEWRWLHYVGVKEVISLILFPSSSSSQTSLSPITSQNHEVRGTTCTSGGFRAVPRLTSLCFRIQPEKQVSMWRSPVKPLARTNNWSASSYLYGRKRHNLVCSENTVAARPGTAKEKSKG